MSLRLPFAFLLFTLGLPSCQFIFGYEPPEVPDAAARDQGYVDGMYKVENPTRSLDARVSEAGACTLWTLVIRADEDDCEIDSYQDAFFPDGEGYKSEADPGGIYMGSWAGKYTWGIFRFHLPQQLPAGAIIHSAKLKLWGDLQWPMWDEAQDALVILLEDDPSAPVVTSFDQAPEGASDTLPADARTVVSASVTWPPREGLRWSLGEYNESPELVSLLDLLRQKHADLSTWTSLQFWLRGLFTTRSAEVMTFDYGMSDFHTPLLQIVWCMAPN